MNDADETAIADIVISRNGRDAGKIFIVIGKEDGYSLIADGRCRRAEKPKRKKNKHLQFHSKAIGPAAEKLSRGESVTNKELRKTLAYIADEDKKDNSGDKGGAV